MTYVLKPKPGFDARRVVWSPADGRIAPICSYCQGPINAHDDPGFVPLILWQRGGPNDGAMAHFCENCMVRWWGFGGA